jgi:hypothetical protein
MLFSPTNKPFSWRSKITGTFLDYLHAENFEKKAMVLEKLA